VSDPFDPANLLCREGVQTGLSARGMPDLMQAMAAPLARDSGVAQSLIAEAFVQRERVGSTAFGGGSVLPHARIAGLRRPTAAFATLAAPIDLDALDRRPVDIVYALISPEGAGADHLKALAAISRFLRDKGLLEKLRGADSADAVLAMMAAKSRNYAA
jgi:PTS system nitrogen regulatory IIA component|tara:strand:- start:5765 stop:6241 length:477 start_codon:yes stop_codon:yes gene_type:complete